MRILVSSNKNSHPEETISTPALELRMNQGISDLESFSRFFFSFLHFFLDFAQRSSESRSANI